MQQHGCQTPRSNRRTHNCCCRANRTSNAIRSDRYIGPAGPCFSSLAAACGSHRLLLPRVPAARRRECSPHGRAGSLSRWQRQRKVGWLRAGLVELAWRSREHAVLLDVLLARNRRPRRPADGPHGTACASRHCRGRPQVVQRRLHAPRGRCRRPAPPGGAQRPGAHAGANSVHVSGCGKARCTADAAADCCGRCSALVASVYRVQAE